MDPTFEDESGAPEKFGLHRQVFFNSITGTMSPGPRRRGWGGGGGYRDQGGGELGGKYFHSIFTENDSEDGGSEVRDRI